MATIMLQACDGAPITVEVKVARCSKFIKTRLEDIGYKDGDVNVLIPIGCVKHVILMKVIEWMRKHKNDPKVVAAARGFVVQEQGSYEITPWDANFLNTDQNTLFELVLAAYNLDIEGLVDMSTETVAKILKEKSPEEIQRNFAE